MRVVIIPDNPLIIALPPSSFNNLPMVRKVPQNSMIAKMPARTSPYMIDGREGTYDASTLISGVEAPKTCLLHRYGPMCFFSFAFWEEGNKRPGCIFRFHLFLLRGGGDTVLVLDCMILLPNQRDCARILACFSLVLTIVGSSEKV